MSSKSMLAEARADEVHLVLSTVASAVQLNNVAQQFAAMETTSLILTKLDESVGLGQILSLLKKSQLPVSYVTNGQNVPEDIAIADQAKLAQMILAAS